MFFNGEPSTTPDGSTEPSAGDTTPATSIASTELPTTPDTRFISGDTDYSSHKGKSWNFGFAGL